MAGKKREENGNHGVDFPASVFVPATVLGRVDCIPADLEVAIALESSRWNVEDRAHEERDVRSLDFLGTSRLGE